MGCECSTLQLKKGLGREESTFMAIPLVDEQMETETVPVKIQKSRPLCHQNCQRHYLLDEDWSQGWVCPRNQALSKECLPNGSTWISRAQETIRWVNAYRVYQTYESTLWDHYAISKEERHDTPIVVDYWALNKVIVQNIFPFSITNDLFDQLNGQYFIKLDLRLGYYQVWIELGDELESTCVIRYEAIEFFVIPFGLTNAPATFCTLLNYVFHEYLD